MRRWPLSRMDTHRWRDTFHGEQRTIARTQDANIRADDAAPVHVTPISGSHRQRSMGLALGVRTQAVAGGPEQPFAMASSALV